MAKFIAVVVTAKRPDLTKPQLIAGGQINRKINRSAKMNFVAKKKTSDHVAYMKRNGRFGDARSIWFKVWWNKFNADQGNEELIRRRNGSKAATHPMDH